MEAKDGAIGNIADFLFDDRTWLARWPVVDTSRPSAKDVSAKTIRGRGICFASRRRGARIRPALIV
ncbi:hypothetical protein [Rhodoblastus sp.]|uniref:hypothetical protein n=1 Tax=Rhodoblastus sp. TaxID=1962975 RepID=UPI003F9B9040